MSTSTDDKTTGELCVLGELLGEGTFGKVYRIKDQQLVIKLIEIEKDDGLPELGELNLLRIIKHPNIMKLDSFVITDKYLGLILPLATTDLGKEFDYSKDQINKWMYQLLSAVYFLHRNKYYHGDIKPCNVLIINDNAVLSDLGLTGKIKNIFDEQQSLPSPQLWKKRGGDITGDIAEQKSNEYQDDIWALGVTFYHMVSRSLGIFNDEEVLSDYLVWDKEKKMKYLERKASGYVDLLMRLLNPIAKERTFNLRELLDNPIFLGHSKYINGKMANVDLDKLNNTFTKGETKKISKAIIDIRKYFYANRNFRNFKLPYNMLFNAIDIVYRIHANLTTSEDIACCFYISTKIYGLSFSTLKFHGLYLKNIIAREANIVKLLNGYLSRIMLTDYFDNKTCENFLDCIQYKPEVYKNLLKLGFKNLKVEDLPF